ncbi:MAG: hypothetical protein FWD23_01250 [Oscillospiraceae bacterium]|nr:hypothetical protein [Oscillospiraceae bacterium]
MKLTEQDVLAEIAVNEPNTAMRRRAVKKLKIQAALGEVAQNDKKTDIRIIALKKLTDQATIGEVAKNDKKTDVRRLALKKLKDQAALGEVAQSDKKTDVRRFAIKKLTDPAALGEAAKNDPNADNRRIALKILKKITARAAKAQNIYLLPQGTGISAENGEIDAVFEKINAAVLEIDVLGKSIHDKAISDDAAAIKNALVKIAAFLDEERKKTDIGRRASRLEQFLGYYVPATIKILESYRQITEYGLEGGNALETKKRIAEAMPFIRGAFEKELDNTYENKMIDITTDIDVLEAMLSKDGIWEM